MTELSGLQIFKYLPRSNCKECGLPTCMAFALKLAKNQADIEACKYTAPELKPILEQSRKKPQKTVEINGIKIGGENVLYRHEKTFINPTAIAVIADTEEKRKRVEDFEITRGANEKLKIDFIFTSRDELKQFPLREAHSAEELINIRCKAILEKDEAYADPVYVYFPHGDLNKTCACAAFYICKYANMLVFEDFDEDMMAALLTLRQNIFTDPQKPLQVEPGIYEFNSPDENSLIFMTTNFALTFFAVANELESLDVPSYLIVVPAEGMSVLTAWSAEKFTAKIAANTLKKFDLANKVKTRKIIIPGLLAHMKEELEAAIPEFEMVVGSNEAYMIKEIV